MQITDKKGGIYVQIANFSIDQVLSGVWPPNQQIPSVRQLAAEAGVTSNTIMHAFAYLKTEGIVATQRGKGLFVTPDGRDKAIALRRREFIEDELPKLKRSMELLGITMPELTRLLQPESPTMN